MQIADKQSKFKSRMIGFSIDGDGNLNPKFQVETSELTEEMIKEATVSDDGNNGLEFDSDGIANLINK